jgi:CheY-like chemotaxis protein
LTGQRTDPGLEGAVVGTTGGNTGGDGPLGMASGMASGTASGTASLAATYVRALLERAGIPRHRHSAHIATLLQLSYHQAHRRMAGGAPWSLEELQAVAGHHGEALIDLFRHQQSADYQSGLLIAGPLRVACRLWPGPLLTQHRAGELIAIKSGAAWVVVVADDTSTPQAFSIRRLIIEPKPDRPEKFAVLDDDVGVARSLASGLIDQGYDAVAFTTAAQLEAALQVDTFDGFVVDWVLGGGTAFGLLSKLRSQNPGSPIALLTGTVGMPGADANEMAAAIQQLGLLFMQKPVTAAIAASQFSAWFAGR